MSDLISREYMKSLGGACIARRLKDGDLCPIISIDLLPSAQSERKMGKWIDYSDEGYVECPFCHSATNCDGNKDELHYCFSCGAELR